MKEFDFHLKNRKERKNPRISGHNVRFIICKESKSLSLQKKRDTCSAASSGISGAGVTVLFKSYSAFVRA
jgi:hypothetical protein